MHRPTPRRLLAIAALLLLSGCASTTAPVLYGGTRASAATPQRLQADIEDCRSRADSAVGVNAANARRVSHQAARRGAVEFVDEAVEQLVTRSRNAWQKARGAAAGAMAGGATGLLLSWNEPDAVYRSHVDLCLKDRGHKVLGWR
jgi:hypothetical protein